jgi:hypothetical protein
MVETIRSSSKAPIIDADRVSHTRTDWSRPAERIDRPSGEKATVKTQSVWPWNVRINSPVPVFQSFRVLS